jgi:hypothetical protein
MRSIFWLDDEILYISLFYIMTTIVSLGADHITRIGEGQYELPNNEIYEELLFGLTDSGWKNKWSVKGDRIVVQTESVQTLKQYLSHHGSMDYHVAERMVMDLGVQIAALGGVKKGILYFSLGDIVVLGNETFIIANLDNIVSLNNASDLVLTHPAKFDGFLPPEMENVKTLPFITNISSAYYSASLMCIHCMGIDKSLDQIYRSKLYFFLKRCLEPDPSRRFFLFI